MTDQFFDAPVLNSPYEYPTQYWELEPETRQPTNQIIDQRRPAEYITPVPLPKGVPPEQIGIFVRSEEQADRAKAAVRVAGLEASEVDGGSEGAAAGRVAVGSMHLAKGLEFRGVAVVACDDEVIPLQSRIEAIVDEADLDDVYDTERQLLYVACTRARDQLLVTGVAPGSEFLDDLQTLRG